MTQPPRKGAAGNKGPNLNDAIAGLIALWSFVLHNWKALSIATSLAVFLFGTWHAGIQVRSKLIQSNESLGPELDHLSARLDSLELSAKTHEAALEDQGSQLTRVLTRTECGDLNRQGEANCKEALRKFHQIYVANHRASEHENCGSTCSQGKLKDALAAEGFAPTVSNEFAFWTKSKDEVGTPVGVIIKPSMSRGDTCKVITAAQAVLGEKLEYLAISDGKRAHQTVVGVSLSSLEGEGFKYKRLTKDHWCFCQGGDDETLFDAAFDRLSPETPAPRSNCKPTLTGIPVP